MSPAVLLLRNYCFSRFAWLNYEKKRNDLKKMRILFAETLRNLRINKKLSQRELAERMYVTRSTVARWESGSRLPDAVMISRLAKCLDTDVNILLSAAVESDDAQNVIMVDDRKIFLAGALPILEEVMTNAIITGFTRPSEAIEYAKANRIALAFLDIELGKTNGLDLCRTLLTINPRTNVVFRQNFKCPRLIFFQLHFLNSPNNFLSPRKIQQRDYIEFRFLHERR